MKPLYTETEFENAKSRELLPLKCKHCEKTFYKTKRDIQSMMNPNQFRLGDFCGNRCHKLHEFPPITVICEQCHKPFIKQGYQIKKYIHHFCNHSCACKYSNTHKTKGTRISKLEKWLAIQLPLLYPSLEFHFNRKDAINSELDIFIPSLKLAFELNGPFHYEPIYGADKLSSTQNNDSRKMLACAEKGIELCVIDVSHQKYFKEQTCKPFLTIICNIINLKLSES